MASRYCRPCYPNTTAVIPCTVSTSQIQHWLYCYPFGRWNRSFPLDCNKVQRYEPLWVDCRVVFNPRTNASFWVCGPKQNGSIFPSIPCRVFRKFSTPVKHDETLFTQNELITYTAAMVLMGFLTLLLNTIVISVFSKSKSLQESRVNYFAVNLAISDLLVAVIAEPLWLIHLWHVHAKHNYGAQLLSTQVYINLLTAYGLIDLASLVSSLTNLACMALERCIVITLPFWYRTKINSWHIFAALITPWLYASVLITTEKEVDWKEIGEMGYRAINFGSGFAVPASVVLISYLIIFISSRKSFTAIAALSSEQQDQRKSRFKELKLAIRLFSLFFIFILCWLPFFTWLFLRAASKGKTAIYYDHRYLYVFKFLTYLNSAINSLMYVVIRKSFIMEMKRMLKQKQNYLRRNTLLTQETGV